MHTKLVNKADRAAVSSARIQQVKDWIDGGIEVRIFTARAAESKNIPAIEEWLVGCGLGGLQITNRKTPDLGMIIDDRAHHAPPNADKEFVTKAAAGPKLQSIRRRKGLCVDCGEMVGTERLDAGQTKCAGCAGAHKAAAAMPEIPTTGPQAILHALKSIDTAKMEEKARQDLQSGSVQRHDKAVRLLGILDGLKRNKTEPHELMLSRVPVIPAAFRPFTTIGEVLVPGDANLLYQDVFRFRDAFRDAHDTLGPTGAGDARLALYDSIKAVFGFGDPVNPKTRAKGVQGFQRVITGSNPKHSFTQRKLISKPMDSVSRGVIVPDPDLDMDQIGIPTSMAWPMYGSHVMGRMVRAGLSEPLALKAVKDQTPDALQYLEQEMRERPVLYSRAPAWHKFNSIAGFPKLVDGDAIRISPMTAAGLNADYDGDQNLSLVFCCLPENKALEMEKENPSLTHSRIMFSKNSFIPLKQGYYHYIVNLEDFPKGELQRTNATDKGPIDFHYAVRGTQVLAHDPEGGVQWRDVSFWSKHYGREIEIVDLTNKYQIVTDDDPRAVYGVDSITLTPSRFTPTQALEAGVFVPRVRTIPESTQSLTEIAGCASRPTQLIQMPQTLPLTADLGWAIGAIAGDGWCSAARKIDGVPCLDYLNLADSTKDNGSKLARILNDMQRAAGLPELAPPNLAYATADETGRFGSTIRFTFCAGPWAEWFRLVTGGWRDDLTAGSRNKHLPAFVLNTPRAFREGVLCGLMDTDGSISTSHAKNKPQLMANMASTSIRLAMETKLLAASLGIPSRITPGKTPKGLDIWMLSFSAEAFQTWGAPYMAQQYKRQHLADVTVAGDSGSAVKADIVPLPTCLVQFFQKQIGCPKLPKIVPGDAAVLGKIKERQSMYQIVFQAKKKGSISRATALRLIATFGEDSIAQQPEGVAWLGIVRDISITWERVIGVQKTGIREDGYDLTVPGYETFMSADGIILSNTLNIHVPALPKSVQEAKDRLLPSKMLFSIKDPDKTVPLPKHEMIWGTFAANNRKVQQVHQFGSRDLALKAVQTGQVDPADEVEFPD